MSISTPKRISFPVIGKAITQGSKKRFAHGLVESNDCKTKTLPANRLKDWRARVAKVAKGCMEAVGREKFSGSVILECEFYFVRPPSHLLKGGEVKERFKDSIPRGDVDKYVRAIGDALTGVVYGDDNQIATVIARKSYSDADYVIVAVESARELS